MCVTVEISIRVLGRRAERAARVYSRFRRECSGGQETGYQAWAPELTLWAVHFYTQTLRLSAWRAHGTGLPAEHDVVPLGLKSLSLNPPQPRSRPQNAEFEAHHSHSAAAKSNRGLAETLCTRYREV